MQRAFEAKLAAVEEERLKTVPGKLPVAKIWRPESVTYEGEIVCYGDNELRTVKAARVHDVVLIDHPADDREPRVISHRHREFRQRRERG